jgi:transposase-like protein
MAFFRKRRKQSRRLTEREPGQAKSVKKRRSFPTVVKILAVDALEAGLSQGEVSEIVGAGSSTLAKWRRLYLEGGEKALMRQAGGVDARTAQDYEEVIVTSHKDWNSIRGPWASPLFH